MDVGIVFAQRRIVGAGARGELQEERSKAGVGVDIFMDVFGLGIGAHQDHREGKDGDAACG